MNLNLSKLEYGKFCVAIQKLSSSIQFDEIDLKEIAHSTIEDLAMPKMEWITLQSLLNAIIEANLKGYPIELFKKVSLQIEAYVLGPLTPEEEDEICIHPVPSKELLAEFEKKPWERVLTK